MTQSQANRCGLLGNGPALEMNAESIVEAHVFMPVLGRQRQVDMCEFRDNLGSVVRLCLNNNNNRTQTKRNETNNSNSNKQCKF